LPQTTLQNPLHPLLEGQVVRKMVIALKILYYLTFGYLFKYFLNR